MTSLVIITRASLGTTCGFISRFVLLLLLLTVSTSAQQTTTDGATPLGVAPGAPAGSYALSGFDNVNLYNGHLNFQLPLLAIGGRGGASYAMKLAIEQKWIVERETNEITNQTNYYPEPGWWQGIASGYGPGVLQGRASGIGKILCSGTTYIYNVALARLTFTAADGTEYEMRDQSTNGQPLGGTSCGGNGSNRGRTFITADGSSATFVSDADIFDNSFYGAQFIVYPSGYLSLRDGTRYRIDSGLVTWLRDRNGNKLSFTYDSFSRVTSVTDSLNRQVTVVYDVNDGAPYGLCDRITYNGFGGATRTIRISKTNLGSVLRSGYSLQTYAQLFPTLNGAGGTTFDPTVASSAWLPDGRRFQFFYNSYGELARVALPTGGAMEYDYGAGLSDGDASGVFGAGINRHIYRRILERRVYADGVTLESKQTYSRPETTGGTNLGYVVMDQLNGSGTLMARQLHYFYGSPKASFNQLPTHYPAWKDAREYKTESFDANGTTVLRRAEHTFQQRAAVSWWTGGADTEPPNDPRLTETLNTLADTNQVSRQTFSYSNDAYNNQTDVYEYDYGSGAAGALIRRAHTDYITTNPVNGADYAGDTSVHLRSLPSQQQVFDAGGTERARTTYEYDNYANDANHVALVDRAGISGLDSGYTTAYTKRGNVTRVSRFVLANTGLVGSDTEFAAYSQYDIAGNVVKTKDPKGNIAQADYSGTYQYALPTTQTSPIPDSSGYYASSTAFTTTIAYDFWTGKVTSTTDANGQTTTAEYNDALGRLTRMVRPTGGGETTYQYSDTISALYLHTQTKQNATTWLDDYTLLDGLGRTWRAAHYEGPNSWSAKETKYDAIRRMSQVSSPYSITAYNASTPSGVLWTTTAYDALSRVTTLTTPDTGFVTTSYSGNVFTVEDQHDPGDPDTTKRVGRKRTSITDALGRITQVTEDPGGLNYQTYYNYDAMGNLVKVNQGTQNRYFLYDSMSRLARVRNVEQDANSSLTTSATGTYSGLGNTQWAMGYTYDANSNLYQRTDARNILTTYGYDALNRNITVSYNDGVTPVVERHYDSAANGKGRLYYSLSYNAHPVGGAAAYSYTQINGYDAMGRMTGQTQNLLNASGAWVPYTVSRTYDLASHVLTQNYPSGRTVTNTYAASGRLNSFGGNLGDGTTRTYADLLAYNPAGQMIKERFGTTTNLYHNIHYNSRLQPVDMRLGISSTDEWTWNRGALITYYSNQARNVGNAFLDAKDNNGNVAMQENYVPTDDLYSSYSLPLRDTYEYDRLNRLTQTNGLQRSSSGAWTSDYAQWYNYDQWGNRTINTGSTWGAGINNLSYTISTTNNRINGVTYDAAGNVTSDPNGVSTATYDGENRMRNALKGGSWSYYVYDADGKRVRRIVGGVETWQVYGIEGELIAEYAVNGGAASPKKDYGYSNGRLLITAEPAQGSIPLQLKWLLADQLGTPRMIVDLSGSLNDNTGTANIYEGVIRHDYLPFGEELLIGMGNGSIRSTAMGYAGSPDSARQKFAGYERDSETGLDYAGARYFASMQGRFINVDPLLGSGEVADPQTWNRYSYTLNNPLKYTDPTGLYVFDNKVQEEQRNAFRAAFTKAQEALNGYKKGSKEYNKIKRALDSYGKEGVDNGVTIMAAKLENNAETQVAGSLGKKTADNPTGQQIRLTLNTDFFNSKTDAAEFSITTAHEGSHIADGSDWVSSGFADSKNPTRYQTEMTAWTVAGMVAQHFNINRGYAGTIPVPNRSWYGLPTVFYIWNRGWAGADAAVIEANRTRDIEGYFNTPPDQGGNAFPGGKGSDKVFKKNTRFRK